MALLEVKNYAVHFRRGGKPIRAVDGVSFTLERGETLGVVGESGSGKTTLFLGMLGLLSRHAANFRGSVRFDGMDITDPAAENIRTLRGRRITMIFQDPMTALNPYLRVETQLFEAIRRSEGASRMDLLSARRQAAALLQAVGIPDAAQRIRQYPHMFSGGMRQRVMVAMALAPAPDLLIADEPTTALDVTVRAQVLRELASAREQYGMAMALISHDIGMVARFAQTMMVLYAGRIMEMGPVTAVLERPAHPYTRALLACQPSLARRGDLLRAVPGAPPLDGAPERGCAFADRCGYAGDRCRAAVPEPIPARTGITGHITSCIRQEEGLW